MNTRPTNRSCQVSFVPVLPSTSLGCPAVSVCSSTGWKSPDVQSRSADQSWCVDQTVLVEARPANSSMLVHEVYPILMSHIPITNFPPTPVSEITQSTLLSIPSSHSAAIMAGHCMQRSHACGGEQLHTHSHLAVWVSLKVLKEAGEQQTVTHLQVLHFSCTT